MTASLAVYTLGGGDGRRAAPTARPTPGARRPVRLTTLVVIVVKSNDRDVESLLVGVSRVLAIRWWQGSSTPLLFGLPQPPDALRRTDLETDHQSGGEPKATAGR